MTSHVLRRLPQPVRVLLAVTSSSTTSCLATQRVPSSACGGLGDQFPVST